MFEKLTEIFGLEQPAQRPILTLAEYHEDTAQRMTRDHIENPCGPGTVKQTGRCISIPIVALEIGTFSEDIAKAVPSLGPEEALVAACDILRKGYGFPVVEQIAFSEGDVEVIRKNAWNMKLREDPPVKRFLGQVSKMMCG